MPKKRRDPLEGLDFAYHPVCDAGRCTNPAAWVGHPGAHRLECHDADHVLVHMLCDGCRKLLESLNGLICNTCQEAGIPVEVLSVHDFYGRFEALEATHG